MSEIKYIGYKNKLPRELLEYSGDNRLANGFIRLCEPQVFEDVMNEGYYEHDAYAFGTTAFGDFLIWEKSRYIKILSFSRHIVSVLESGFDFFFEDISDEAFMDKNFDYSLYREAVDNLGECGDDECFVSSPIPAVSGKLDLQNLSVGKVREYAVMSIDLVGKIELLKA